MPPALCRSEESVLVLVDIQARLAAAMPEADRARVLRNTGILTQAAGVLSIPVIVTEQYRKGLGATEEEVARHLSDEAAVIEKTCFACTGSDPFREALDRQKRRQVVLAGMEAHVCVLQTAVGLIAQGFEVFVVEDAVSSRSPANHRNAMERLRGSAVITNVESVLFEWLRDARHEQFKSISALIK